MPARSRRLRFSRKFDLISATFHNASMITYCVSPFFFLFFFFFFFLERCGIKLGEENASRLFYVILRFPGVCQQWLFGVAMLDRIVS